MLIHRYVTALAAILVLSLTVPGDFAHSARAQDKSGSSENGEEGSARPTSRRAFEGFLRNFSASVFQGVTPLMHVARSEDMKETDRVKALKGLIERGADVDATSKHGWTALMFAAWKGNEKAVEVLLDAGADPDIVSKRIAVATTAPTPKTTALRQALLNHHVAIANMLLDHGAAVDSECIVLAAGTGDVALLKRIHKQQPNLNQQSSVSYYSTPLGMAARNGRLEALKWLLKNGADPYHRAQARIALLEAVVGDHFEIVEHLLLEALDPDRLSRNALGAALFRAATKRTKPENHIPNLKIIRLLVKHGADPAYRSRLPYHKGKSVEIFARERRAGTAARIKPSMSKESRTRIERDLEHQDAIIDLLAG